MTMSHVKMFTTNNQEMIVLLMKNFAKFMFHER
ncbi:hypothetical protein CAEBREN_09728 [Caenorhabditis brenneri]|uniref:Uncharacterized protein n=1 Tax=Caenorhabditis brenneri TaxID=135651 RepID=G0MMU8_CAEBE|nr:hypothetical protein CAEBREN_09728 [Caenorhabditis brenneri]